MFKLFDFACQKWLFVQNVCAKICVVCVLAPVYSLQLNTEKWLFSFVGISLLLLCVHFSWNWLGGQTDWKVSARSHWNEEVQAPKHIAFAGSIIAWWKTLHHLAFDDKWRFETVHAQKEICEQNYQLNLCSSKWRLHMFSFCNFSCSMSVCLNSCHLLWEVYKAWNTLHNKKLYTGTWQPGIVCKYTLFHAAFHLLAPLLFPNCRLLLETFSSD